MSKRDHLRISWDYDSVFSKWIYENTINNNLLNKNKLVIALYDNNKKIKTFFGVDIYPLRRSEYERKLCNSLFSEWHACRTTNKMSCKDSAYCRIGHHDNEVRLNTLYTPSELIDHYMTVDRSKLEGEYDIVKKYLRIYGRSDYYDRVSVETISENILHFKFLKSSPSANGGGGIWISDNYAREQGSRVVRSSIYILNFSQFKNGYISFYLNSINENSHLFSKNFDELKSLPYINFLNVSTIQKVSSDPEDCEYVWDTDSECIAETGSPSGYQREIVRITELSANGGVPCNVGTYGVVRYAECSNQVPQSVDDPDTQPAPAPAPASERWVHQNSEQIAERTAEEHRTRVCRIGCQTYGGDYWCASKDDPKTNDCDKFL